MVRLYVKYHTSGMAKDEVVARSYYLEGTQERECLEKCDSLRSQDNVSRVVLTLMDESTRWEWHDG